MEASLFKKKILINKFYKKNKFNHFKNISTFKFNDSEDGCRKLLRNIYKKEKLSKNFKLHKKYTDIKKFISILENKYLSFR